MAKRIQVGGRIESKEVGGIVTGAAEILDDAKGKKQSVINQDTDDELLRLDQSKQNNLTFDNAPTEDSNNPVKSGGVYAADKALSDAIEAILLLIPSAASALNKLVDTDMMNSSISTATATFRGTYNVVTDLSLTVDATHEQIAAALGNVISTADNNDYAFVQVPVSAESTDIRRTERYKFNGTAWGYEYDLNTSGFTAAQWAAINSGITLALVGKLIGLPTSSELQALLGQKQDTLTFDNIPVSGSANPVKSGGVYSAINDEKTAREQLAQTVTGINGRVGNVEEVIPTGATANNKLVANNSMEAYVTSIIEAITASFTIATADGHINLTLTQTNGRVTSITLTSSDIASAQALTALTGRVSSAEGNITSLGGRVSTNETDIANLQQLYNDLQQSKPEPVTALPETGQQQGVIYRLAGTTSYSDYMWNGSTWVLMATYNNAIDPRPKKASQNLVTSGGVFDNIGALDVSELNATENPHTLAQYVDLSAALAAIPTDYQKGGMSIKFVQISDNKYVQYRLASNEWNTDESNWIESGKEPSLYQVPLNIGYYAITEIGSTMTFDIQPNVNYRCAKINCSQGDIFFVSGTEQVASVTAPYAFTDANGKVLTRLYSSAVTNGYAKAPSGAVYFVFSATRETAMLYYYPFKSAMAQAVYSILENTLFECTTAAATASKNITISGFQNFPITFDAGFHLLVKFTNNNTANNVTFKDDKPLYYNGARASATNTWKAGDILEMFNDGTNWYAKEATGKDIAAIYSAIDKINATQEVNGIKELQLSTDGGIYTIGNVGTTVDLSSIDTSNNKGTDFVHSAYDCKEGDAFIFTGFSKNPTVVLYAVLDEDNKILFRGEAGRSYSVATVYTNAPILIPKNGVKFICNNYVNEPKKIYYAEKKGAFATSKANKSQIGFEHVHLENTLSAAVQYVFPDNALYYPTEGGQVLVKVNTGDTKYHLQAHWLTNGTYRPQSITALTTGVVYRLVSSDVDGTLLGISFTLDNSTSPYDDVALDVDIYKNDSYISERKADKPSDFTETHIAVFDENGNPVDSGYDVNNLPYSSDLPSGGNDGEVLATDGNGNYYWVTVPTTTTTDVSQTFGVLVDQYEDLNTGVSFVPAIKKAIEVAGIGGTVVFTPNKTYNIDDTIEPLDGQVFIGNGATLKRMNESSASVAVAIESSTTNDVTLDSVPDNWKIGDTLLFYDSAQGLLGNYIAYANIAAINGNTITVTGKSANPWSLPVGTKVTKSVVMLSGVQYPTPVGFKVYNLVFDGNKANNGSLLNWYIHGTIRSFGHNTVISDCKFYNIPTENIITQGAMIRNNYAQDLNGSFVHLSCPSENLLGGNERYMGTFVIGNMCNRVCCVDNSIMKHSEAPITYSWNAGKLIVEGNQFYGNGVSRCIQMDVNVPSEPESSSEVSSNGYMIYVGNIFNNFAKIGELPDNPYINRTNKNRLFSDNIFKDCGTNDMNALYELDIRFENNFYQGDTVVNTGGNTLMYRIDTEIDSTPSASALSTKYTELPEGGQVYITQLQKQYRKITVNNSIVWIDESIQVIS